MGDFNYQRYLASREWGLLKKQIRQRSGGNCERGHSEPVKARDVHHLTYERLGHEDMEDLLHVCEACHEYLSGLTDVDPVSLLLCADQQEWDEICNFVAAQLLHRYAELFGALPLDAGLKSQLEYQAEHRSKRLRPQLVIQATRDWLAYLRTIKREVA